MNWAKWHTGPAAGANEEAEDEGWADASGGEGCLAPCSVPGGQRPAVPAEVVVTAPRGFAAPARGKAATRVRGHAGSLLDGPVLCKAVCKHVLSLS